MASKYDWQQIVGRIRSRWGPLAKSWNQAERLAIDDPHVAKASYGALVDAVDSFVGEGHKWAPSPSMVIARAREGRVVEGRPDPSSCDHPEPWALLADGSWLCRVCLEPLKEVDDES